MNLRFSAEDVKNKPTFSHVDLTLELAETNYLGRFFSEAIVRGLRREIVIQPEDTLPLVNAVRLYTPRETPDGLEQSRCYRHSPNTLDRLSKLVTRYALYGKDVMGQAKPGMHTIHGQISDSALGLMSEVMAQLLASNGDVDLSDEWAELTAVPNIPDGIDGDIEET